MLILALGSSKERINSVFEKKIDRELLNLAQVTYGGEFFFNLKNFRLKELDLSGSNFEKVQDSLLSKKGNNNFYSYKNISTGFVACLFEALKGNKLVIAYRGTERIGLGENVSDLAAFMKDVKTDINLMNGVIDEQFLDAWRFYKLVKKQYPKSKIIIVGQSLGGALAQLVPAKEYTINRKKVEAYSYNAPGCKHLLDEFGCNTKFSYSFITNYSVMNDWCGMFGEHIGTRYLIAPIQLKEVDRDSQVDVINNVLLTTHEGIFDYTKEKMGKVIKKPKDFNQEEGLSLWYFDKNNPIKEFQSLSDFTRLSIPNFNIAESEFITESVQNAKKFIKENAPEEFLNVATAIKNVTNNFIQEQAENTEKLMENLNNNALSNAIKQLDAVMSALTDENLQQATKIVEKRFKR